MTGLSAWQPHRVPEVGFEALFPCSPRHEVAVLAGQPDRDVQRHVIRAEVPGCHIHVHADLIKWQPSAYKMRNATGRELEFGELLPWEKGVFERALEEVLAPHGHPTPRRLAGHVWNGEIRFPGSFGTTVARFAWYVQTPFSGGSRWTVAAITADPAEIQQFFESFVVSSSDWLTADLWQGMADHCRDSE